MANDEGLGCFRGGWAALIAFGFVWLVSEADGRGQHEGAGSSGEESDQGGFHRRRTLTV